MEIVGQLDKETCKQLDNGAVKEFPLEWDFIKTTNGYVSSHELLLLIHRAFKGESFIIKVEPFDGEIQTNRLGREILNDILGE